MRQCVGRDVASGTDRHLDIRRTYFGLRYRVVESSSIPTSPIFKNYLLPYFFDDPLPSLVWWAGRYLSGAPIEPAKDLSLAHSSGRMVSSGISDVVIASVHSVKIRLKTLTKIMMMMITIIITEKPFTRK